MIRRDLQDFGTLSSICNINFWLLKQTLPECFLVLCLPDVCLDAEEISSHYFISCALDFRGQHVSTNESGNLWFRALFITHYDLMIQ